MIRGATGWDERGFALRRHAALASARRPAGGENRGDV